MLACSHTRVLTDSIRVHNIIDRHYNDERLHATLGYMAPVIWHRGKPEDVRDERARQIATARTYRGTVGQQRLNAAA